MVSPSLSVLVRCGFHKVVNVYQGHFGLSFHSKLVNYRSTWHLTQLTHVLHQIVVTHAVNGRVIRASFLCSKIRYVSKERVNGYQYILLHTVHLEGVPNRVQ